MRLFFLNQFYPPDRAPTGAMLQAVVAEAVAAGHTVEVWCGGGRYEQSRTGGGIDRADTHSSLPGFVVHRIGNLGGDRKLPAKLRSWLGFYLLLAWRLMCSQHQPDLIVAMTTPPFLSVLARVAAWRHRCRHAHWPMDLYPDVMVAHGMLRDGGLPHRVLRGLARFGLGGPRCGGVVTLGPCMAARLQTMTHRPVVWVPLWSNDTAADAPPAPAMDSASGMLHILYSGNLGRGHPIQPVLDAIRSLAGRGIPIHWTFAVRGARQGEVVEFAHQYPELPLVLRDPVPADELAAHLAAADIHLATLDPAWSGCMVPSKIQGSFAAGRAILWVGPADASAAMWIREAGAGWVVEPADAANALVALLSAPDLREQARARGQAAARFAATHFHRTANARATLAALLAK